MRAVFLLVTFLGLGTGGHLYAQPGSSKKPVAATILLDHNGKVLSDEEFVDIRMANYQSPDASITRVLDDGTREITTAKIPQEGTLAPDFYGRFLDGTPVSLSNFKGKVLVLNFWFIGCPACIDEEPKLQALRTKFIKNPDVEFVSMTADKAEAVKKYLTTNKTNYKMVADAATALEAFDFGGYPKNIVIGRDGRIVYWRSTVKAWTKFESVIWAELAKEP